MSQAFSPAGKPSTFDYGWVVVGVGALMTCIGMGAMMSLAVFLQPISKAPDGRAPASRRPPR